MSAQFKIPINKKSLIIELIVCIILVSLLFWVLVYIVFPTPEEPLPSINEILPAFQASIKNDLPIPDSIAKFLMFYGLLASGIGSLFYAIFHLVFGLKVSYSVSEDKLFIKEKPWHKTEEVFLKDVKAILVRRGDAPCKTDLKLVIDNDEWVLENISKPREVKKEIERLVQISKNKK